MRISKPFLKAGPLVRWRSAAIVASVAGAVTMAGCLSLQVDNPNTLNLSSVYSNAANTEAALIGGWKRLYGVMVGTGTNNGNNNCPGVVLAVWGNALTYVPNTYYLEGGSEPRVPINNLNTLQCATRGPWYDVYSGIASGRESYQGIIANNLKYGAVNATTPNGADTPLRLLFGKFLIAVGQLNVALRFDRVFATDITTPLGWTPGEADLKTYQEGLAHAKKLFREVIADANAIPSFTFPTTWINGNALTKDDFIRVCMTYINRADIYGPRNVAERTAAPWSTILARLDSGINKDFFVDADPAVALTANTWVNQTFTTGTGTTNASVRANNRLLGPGDTSGVYQAWLNTPLATRTSITITSPDRRIHGATNTTTGTRFTYLTTNQGNAALNPWVVSKYRVIRYLNTAADSGSNMLVPMLSMEEQKFIRAEALYRLGRLTEAAALINPTRIAANLKPVDANGPPAGRDCVPRKDNGTCGDLFDAIQYEKRIEMFPGMEADMWWYDARGWGKMIPGTPYHLPISGRELIQLKIPYYTFGGIGSPGTSN